MLGTASNENIAAALAMVVLTFSFDSTHNESLRNRSSVVLRPSS